MASDLNVLGKRKFYVWNIFGCFPLLSPFACKISQKKSLICPVREGLVRINSISEILIKKLQQVNILIFLLQFFLIKISEIELIHTKPSRTGQIRDFFWEILQTKGVGSGQQQNTIRHWISSSLTHLYLMPFRVQSPLRGNLLPRFWAVKPWN